MGESSIIAFGELGQPINGKHGIRYRGRSFEYVPGTDRFEITTLPPVTTHVDAHERYRRNLMADRSNHGCLNGECIQDMDAYEWANMDNHFTLFSELFHRGIMDTVNSIADIGCGQGQQALLFASMRPDMTVYAVDDDKLALYMTRMNCSHNRHISGNITVLKQDFNHLSLPGKVDVIHANCSFHGIDRDDAVSSFRTIRHNLVDGGMLASNQIGMNTMDVIASRFTELLGRRGYDFVDAFSMGGLYHPDEVLLRSHIELAGFTDVDIITKRLPITSVEAHEDLTKCIGDFKQWGMDNGVADDDITDVIDEVSSEIDTDPSPYAMFGHFVFALNPVGDSDGGQR